MRFFCSKDCPDLCVFDIQHVGPCGVSFSPIRKRFLRKGFLCSKLKGFYNLDVLSRDSSFFASSHGRVYSGVLEKLSDFLNKSRNKRILFYRGSGSLGYYMEFWDLLFSSFENCYFVEGSPCDESGIEAHVEDFGCCVNPDVTNLEHVDSVVLFGKNPRVTSPHLYAYLVDLVGRGKNLVCVDPVKSETSHLATRYIRIRPGTDGLLAHAILTELGYVKGDTENLLGITGVGDDDFRYLINLFSEGRCAIIEGYSLQRYSNGKNAVQWLNRLAYYTDNLDFLYYGRSSKERLKRPDIARRNTIPISSVVDRMKEGFFDVIVVVASNPVVTFPEAGVWEAALEKTPLVVVGTHVDETASLADYFIRVGGMFSQGDVGGSYFFNEEATRGRFIEHIPSDIDVVTKLGSYLGIDMDIPDSVMPDVERRVPKRVFSGKEIDVKHPLLPPKGCLRLLTRSHKGYLNSQRVCDVREVVYISEHDAKRLSLVSGDRILVAGELGSFSSFAEVDDVVPQGCAVMFKSLSPSVNRITPCKPTDVVSALSFYDVFVRVKKDT